MDCTRCGATDVMLYPCPHCGRQYCGPHRYPRHGCVTGDGRDSPADRAGGAAPPVRSMDVGEPPGSLEDPDSVAEWMRRQTYLTFVATVSAVALLASAVVWFVVLVVRLPV